MNKKTFSTIIFISSIVVLLFSILGLIMLNLSYLTITGETYLPGFGFVNVTVYYSGYELIFDNTKLAVEPLLHFIGFILFLVGSLIVLIISSINCFSKEESKKIEIKYNGVNKSKKKLKILGIIIGIILVLVAILVIIFGFICFYGGSNGVTYSIGVAKVFASFLLGFNFLIAAFILNLVLYNLGLYNSNSN